MGKALVNKNKKSLRISPTLDLYWEYKTFDGNHLVYVNKETKQYKYICVKNNNNIIDTEMYKNKQGVLNAMIRVEKAFHTPAEYKVSNLFGETIKKRKQ